MKETVRAVKIFSDYVSILGIKNKNTFYAISSGVKNQAELSGNLPKLNELIDQIRLSINDQRKKIIVLDIWEEPRLGHLGIIHKQGRHYAYLIDIGSGNTKGGCFVNNNFDAFSFPLGTTSLNKYIDQNYRSQSIHEYYLILQKKIDSIRRDEIVPMITAKGALIRNKKNVILSGGISWAIATIMYPEYTNDEAFVKLTMEDIIKFKEKVLFKYEELLNISSYKYKLANLESYLHKKAVKELETVFLTFDQKAMLAGSMLLEATLKEISSTSIPQEFYLARYGYVGWITGFVVESLGGD
jgi:hypothetical protein